MGGKERSPPEFINKRPRGVPVLWRLKKKKKVEAGFVTTGKYGRKRHCKETDSETISETLGEKDLLTLKREESGRKLQRVSDEGERLTTPIMSRRKKETLDNVSDTGNFNGRTPLMEKQQGPGDWEDLVNWRSTKDRVLRLGGRKDTRDGAALLYLDKLPAARKTEIHA